MHNKIFIGGPISNLNSTHQMQNFIEHHKKLANNLINNGYEVLSAHIIEKYGAERLKDDETITSRDFNWVDEADICIFLFPTDNDIVVRTDGAFIEIGYAVAKKKKSLIFWDEKDRDEYSPMFRGLTAYNMQFYSIYDIDNILNIIKNGNFVD